MAFADDIAIIADSRLALTKAITIIENWCKVNIMSLNKEKSQIILILTRWYKSQ